MEYEDRLRLLGRELDRRHLQAPALAEVSGGFVVCAARPGAAWRETLALDDAALALLADGADEARRAPRGRRAIRALVPSGYEDLLRAIGWRLDVQRARGIAVVELADAVAVTGLGRGAAGRRPFSELYSAAGVVALLADSAARRTPALPAPPARTLRGMPVPPPAAPAADDAGRRARRAGPTLTKRGHAS